MSGPGSAPAVADGRRFGAARRRAIVAGSVGNAVEWTDWVLYATLAPFISGRFFPGDDETVKLLNTLAVFAVGFLMRPIGGAVLGGYADRRGRKAGLTLTISLMAGASLVIAVCPPYSSIGVAAPVILLLARLVQGFSAGGEFASSSSFLVESAPPGRRAFAGSWQQVSVGAGALIASAIGAALTWLVPPGPMAEWGWRVGFAVGALLGLVGLWVRVRADETDAFTAMVAQGRHTRTVRELARGVLAQPGGMLRVVGMNLAGTIAYYLFLTYMPGYAHKATGIPLDAALLANTIGLVYYLAMIPLVARAADRFGRRPVLLAFAVGLLAVAWPAFRILEAGTFVAVLVVEVLGLTCLACYSATIAAVMSEQFPARVRTTAMGFSYSLTVALFGGTAPYVTTWMQSRGLGGHVWLYPAVAAVIGVVVYALMPETNDRELD
ncbi:MFS transporter [Pseudonocardia acaciae]|uniref:MFS transporter n=1 Tax=Pseudonocardia acaciae TaxID=551276 RepID=UPI00068854B8|nr:MFS transporter [Pseudonocardia acaciae]